MDLSKAFDCLPHDLLLLKAKHYGLSDSAQSLLSSYLDSRKQCVKLGDVLSSFSNIQKGVPQGSILGPLLFNIFVNDIFDFVKHGTLYNYADDNTLSYHSTSIEDLIDVLQNESKSLTNWFHINHMKANPDKFQAIALGKKTHDQEIVFDIDGALIHCEDEVNLLGVTFDFLLKSNTRVTNISKKASRQLNVMKRLGHCLNKLAKVTMYHSFVLSNFNYCPLTWSFTNETNLKKLEKIQERALRFIYHDKSSSYEDLLEQSGFPSLKIRRMRTIAIEAFKITQKKCPEYLQDLLSIKESNYNFRYSNKASLPNVRTTSYGKKSFRFNAPQIWNSLPNHFRELSSFAQFKSLITSWNGVSCRCSLCKM